MKLNNAFSSNRPRPKKSEIIVDNSRENIDPHIRTKVVSTKELTLSDGSGAGFVKNDANGVLSGGNAGASTVEGTDVLSTGEGGGTKYLREDGDGTCSWQAASATVEGTAVLSTGEGGGTKFLREDGDNTCSWQTVASPSHTMASHSDDDTYNISTTGTAATGVLTVTGGATFALTDNTAEIFGLAEGANKYMCVDTSNGAEEITFGCGAGASVFTITQSSVSATQNFDVTGNITVSGTVDGVDIAARDHAESHTVASHSDTTMTGAESETLTDGSNADSLHVHEGTAVKSTGEAGGSKFLREDGDGTCSWQASPGANHAILDGSVHSDSVADGVTRGSIIYGNSTPKWDELAIGADGTVLTSDGTDISWAAPSGGGACYLMFQQGSNSSVNSGNTVYNAPSGLQIWNSLAKYVEMIVPESTTCSDMSVSVENNTLNGTATFAIYLNTAGVGNQSVQFAAATTGNGTDAANTDNLSQYDELCTRLVTLTDSGSIYHYRISYKCS